MTCPKCAGPNICGHEVSGVYDGVLFWACLDCGHAWAQDWTGYGSLQVTADEWVAQYIAANEVAS